MQRPVRLGLIGCGGIVRQSHAPGYRAIPELVRVTALADPVADNLSGMGEMLAVPPERRYADYREMLKRAELDAVTIATPHHMHAGQAMDAAAAGVAVISEKPMATSVEQAEEVLAAVRRNGVPYAVVHNFLFTPGMERARALLGEGAVGTPFFGRAKSLFNKTDDRADPNNEWRASRAAGGGAINDTAYHEIYLLETLVGAPVRYVEARVATQHFAFDVDDLALLLLEHEGGALSTVATSWCVPGDGGAGARDAGESANLAEVQGPAGGVRVMRRGRGLWQYARATRQWQEEALPPQPAWAESGHGRYFAATFAALAAGEPPPVGGELALHNLRIIAAARRATAERRAVELPAPRT
ncbi:MAG: Gfo/Idh/MocA family oxidoreductase [Spirochaetaceae bacterium]|nr:Gfo/Idh/MocA family oxidoreductase [Spirochaetaceae bacterium]